MATRKDGNTYQIHHNTSFHGEKTKLYLVGVGLGDITVIHQIGVSFIEMCENGLDPELGKVVISFGSTLSALYPMRGDYNVWWCWGHTEDWIQRYFNEVKIKPTLVLCPSMDCLNAVSENHNVATLHAPLAAADIFKPLHLKREGLGYSGLDTKTSSQMRVVLYPVLRRRDFEWRKGDWVMLDKLNEWYNSKLIIFGMIKEVSLNYGMLTNRVFEVFGSGTPLIYPANKGFKETFGVDYRYQTANKEQTLSFVEEIIDKPQEALEYMETFSKKVEKEHNYKLRLENIFAKLEEM